MILDYSFIIMGFVVALMYKLITKFVVMWFKCVYYELKMKDHDIEDNIRDITIVDIILVRVRYK